jgi:TolA-binding protein
MTDDALSRATSALRELGEQPDASQRFTRTRVMASLHKRRRTRQSRLYVLVPLAALLIGSTAAGAVSGRLPKAWSVLSAVVAPANAPASQATSQAVAPKRALPKARAPAASQAEAPPSEPPPSEPSPNEAPPSELSQAEAPRAGSAPPPSEKASRVVVDDRGHTLYRAAHHAHFVDGDAAQALRAWDAYLSHAPGGRFALEARYNRAICLVRLGRHAEARAALEAFAAGTYGSYRQSEARSLLDVLETRD